MHTRLLPRLTMLRLPPTSLPRYSTNATRTPCYHHNPGSQHRCYLPKRPAAPWPLASCCVCRSWLAASRRAYSLIRPRISHGPGTCNTTCWATAARSSYPTRSQHRPWLVLVSHPLTIPSMARPCRPRAEMATNRRLEFGGFIVVFPSRRGTCHRRSSGVDW
ncbi:uncharacterized protein M421DRAFT_302858 [Didymella exigua CBS 183.55]|uniref:Uncharacterized protein n=1 Tax=Didymella exigua CBS 183.55 TaxID=1150837 RepID=A0A6A5R6N6_9PLEO|nr:uncharacterized protein M421DRAFT_302858 [Didymella exigua CBS 183.55]KAF1923831.1 hypothetical protein M421DRAFT_302858 [Didymella exigua CBS 183.55]